MRTQIALVLTASVLFLQDARSQRNATEAAANLYSSVVRITACSCEDRDKRVGSGFVWRDATTVVTALHVMSGCKTVSVTYEARNQPLQATPTKFSAEADLVLLQVKDPPKGRVMMIRAGKVNLGEDLVAIGYGSGKPKMDTTSLRLRFGGSMLREILPKEGADELGNCKSPSLDLQIANVEGHLVPCLSCAPILDSTGRLFAIA